MLAELMGGSQGGDPMRRSMIAQALLSAGGYFGQARDRRSPGILQAGMNNILDLQQQQAQQQAAQQQAAAYQEMLAGSSFSDAQRQVLSGMDPQIGQRLVAQSMMDNGGQFDRYKVVGGTLVDMAAEGGPAPVYTPEGRGGRIRVGADGSVMIDVGGGGVAPGPVGLGAPAQPGDTRPRADFRGALGGSGALTNLLNTVGDVAGVGLADPAVSRAVNELENLSVRTMTVAQDAVPGRPSNYLLELLRDQTVEPASIFTGPDGALDQMYATRDLLRGAIEQNRSLLRSGGLTRSQSGKAKEKLAGLTALVRDYDFVISELQGAQPRPQAPARAPAQAAPLPEAVVPEQAPSGGAARRQSRAERAEAAELPPAPDGVDPNIWQFMTPEERALWN